MKKLDTSKFEKWENFRDKLLQDPKVRHEYDLLEPEYKLIGKLIELRREKNISQKELARRMGTKQSAISRMENSQLSSTLYYLSKLARALGKKLVVDFK